MRLILPARTHDDPGRTAGMRPGDRVLITGAKHPWCGHTGTLSRRMPVSPISRELGWRVELDNGMAACAGDDVLKLV